MDHIYCGIKFPAPRNFERIKVNVNFNENSAALKERIKNEILETKENCEISLFYLGSLLADDEPLNKQPNIRSGSTIQVLKKPQEEEIKTYAKFTEIDVNKVLSLFRSLNSGNFHKISRPEVIKTIFSKHPELEKDIVAMSFLKDPILLATLQNPETVRNMGENHRSLIEASESIVKSLRSVKSLTFADAPPAPIQPSFDNDFSDSSSSGSEANSPHASTSAGNRGARITSELLRRSLAAAQPNRNSLASISQRNLSQASGISPSSSSTSVPNRRNIISSSMFMNAINEVLQSRRSENEVSPNVSQEEEPMPEVAQPEQPQESEQMQTEDDETAREARAQADDEMIISFQEQLRQMEEMGLKNKIQNIQALMVCNGNLEAAVNFVLAEMNLN